MASQNGHLKIVKLLLERGANVNHARTDQGKVLICYDLAYRCASVVCDCRERTFGQEVTCYALIAF